MGVSGGIIVERGEGRPPSEPVATGFIAPGVVNCHTHLGDAGFDPGGKHTLEGLVAPPDGLKHWYLSTVDPGVQAARMAAYWADMQESGFSAAVDFREGGAEGCETLKKTVPGAIALGRPRSSDFDGEEVSRLLDVADGIGLSGLGDVPYPYAETLSDECRRRGKAFALHLSEAVREDVEAALSLEPDFVVHMSSATKGDIARCADAGVPIVVCPRSNAYFGLEPPVADMLSEGAHVALGTDNAMLSDGSLRGEVSALAALLAKQGRDPSESLAVAFEGWKKILYDKRKIGGRIGDKADFTVFPSGKGTLPLDAMRGKDRIRIRGTG